jgi:hypothetical protein
VSFFARSDEHHEGPYGIDNENSTIVSRLDENMLAWTCLAETIQKCSGNWNRDRIRGNGI